VNVLFPAESVKFEGDFTSIEMVADSGNMVRRGFCPKCGSQLFSATIEPAGMPIRIRSGVLDDPELIAPQAIIWTDSAPKWAILRPAPIPERAAPSARQQDKLVMFLDELRTAGMKAYLIMVEVLDKDLSQFERLPFIARREG
jgi:hypothetical protein